MNTKDNLFNNLWIEKIANEASRLISDKLLDACALAPCSNFAKTLSIDVYSSSARKC